MLISWPGESKTFEGSLFGVHQWAMQHFTYVRDEERWKGQLGYSGDHWESDAELLEDLETTGRVHGDCDAFAKLCWIACRKLGLLSRLVVCLTETKEGHLVCEAGGMILDNRQPVIAARQDLERLGYRFLSMSGYNPGEQWTLVM